MKDLFGNELTVEQARVLEHGRGRISKSGKKRYDQPNGYAARPGSGPKGETCKTCEYAVCQGTYRKNFWKCARHPLAKSGWTAGPGTDIRLKAPACKFWELKKLVPFRTDPVLTDQPPI